MAYLQSTGYVERFPVQEIPNQMSPGDDAVFVERVGMIVELDEGIEVDSSTARFLHAGDGRRTEMSQEGVVVRVHFQIGLVKFARIVHSHDQIDLILMGGLLNILLLLQYSRAVAEGEG